MRPRTVSHLFLSVSLAVFYGAWPATPQWLGHGVEVCPESCVCINAQAHCDSLSLKHMPRPLSRNLEALHLRNNLIHRIHRGHFGHLRQLKHLSLKGNRLSSIAVDAFREQRNLLSLSLTENKLSSLAPDTFKTLGQLRFLSLRKNQISDVEGLFSRLYSLQLLNVAKNRIKKITHKTFRNNWQLIVLDLHSNRISYVHQHAFRAMPLIRYLVLRDNPLKALEVNFKPNIHLELLDFTNCQLTEVVKGLPFSINDLRLSENRITKINRKNFRNTRRIRLLVLTNNQIDFIDDRAFSRMLHLYDLYLGNNRLERLPKFLPRGIHGIFLNANNLTRINKAALLNNHALEHLSVCSNYIDDIEQGTFWSLGNLRSLDLSDNFIEDIKSHTFQGNKHLQKLDISRNPILKLDHDTFAGLENLHIFEMSSIGSHLDEPRIHPVIFKHMKKLLYLDLSNSSQVVHGMKDHPYSLDYITSVEDLNLMEDNLRGLPALFPNHFPNLHVIKLVGNPWHCNYDILWLAYWMRNQTVDFFAPNFMRCASPPELLGVLISELTPADLLPVTKKKPIIEYIEISLKEYVGDTNYSIYYTRDPHSTPPPEQDGGSDSLADPNYRSTVTNRFNFGNPHQADRNRNKAKSHKNKASRNNNTLKQRRGRNHGNRDSRRHRNRETGSPRTRPPDLYTSLRERYIDPQTFRTMAPIYMDLYRPTKQTTPPKRKVFNEVRQIAKQQNRHRSRQDRIRSKWNIVNSVESRRDEYSGSSGERGV